MSPALLRSDAVDQDLDHREHLGFSAAEESVTDEPDGTRQDREPRIDGCLGLYVAVIAGGIIGGVVGFVNGFDDTAPAYAFIRAMWRMPVYGVIGALVGALLAGLAFSVARQLWREEQQPCSEEPHDGEVRRDQDVDREPPPADGT